MDLLSQLCNLGTVLRVGVGELRRQQMAQCISCQVQFASLAVLRTIVTCFCATFRRALYRLTVDNHRAWLCCASCCQAQDDAQVVYCWRAVHQ